MIGKYSPLGYILVLEYQATSRTCFNEQLEKKLNYSVIISYKYTLEW